MTREKRFTLILRFWLLGSLGWLAPLADAHAQQPKAAEQAGATERPRRIPQRSFVQSGSISRLVFAPPVCDELGITPEYRQELLKAVSRAEAPFDFQQRHVDLRNAGTRWHAAQRSGDAEQIAAAAIELAEAQRRIDEVTAARDRAVRQMLTPAQYRRLVQILLQQEGIRALSRPEVAAQVGLTEPQVVQFQQILAARERELQAWRRHLAQRSQADGSAEEAVRLNKIAAFERPLSKDEQRRLNEIEQRGRSNRDELDRFEERVDAQLWRVLTPAQRRRFNRLCGEPFDLERLTRQAADRERLAWQAQYETEDPPKSEESPEPEKEEDEESKEGRSS